MKAMHHIDGFVHASESHTSQLAAIYYMKDIFPIYMALKLSIAGASTSTAFSAKKRRIGQSRSSGPVGKALAQAVSKGVPYTYIPALFYPNLLCKKWFKEMFLRWYM